MKARILRLTGFIPALLAAAMGPMACHTTTEPAQVGSVFVEPSGATLAMGETLQLSVTVRDIGGGILTNPSVSFQSSSPSIATVDGNGRVTAVTVGSVTITVSSGPQHATASLQVSPKASVALGLGTSFTCALTESGAAYCWGTNGAGQLGNGPLSSSSVPVPVSGGLIFKAIAVGNNSACGLDPGGRAYCWGANLQGQLGNGTRVDSPVPVPVSGSLQFESLAVGAGFGCGLNASGLVYCWGSNSHGQLGISDPLGSLAPVLVTAGSLRFVSLGAGIFHACSLTAAGMAYCWGGNQFSQLGDGTSTNRASPVPVGGGLLFTSINPGATTTCGIAAGVSYCWGLDLFGSLGQGSKDGLIELKLPAAVVGGIPFASIRAGAGNNTFTAGCGVRATDAAYCWGANNLGQLGAIVPPGSCAGTDTTACSGTPLPVSGGHHFKVVVPGAAQACGITTTHSLLCWGWNGSGQVGDGTTQDRFAPVAVAGALRTP